MPRSTTAKIITAKFTAVNPIASDIAQATPVQFPFILMFSLMYLSSLLISIYTSLKSKRAYCPPIFTAANPSSISEAQSNMKSVT